MNNKIKKYSNHGKSGTKEYKKLKARERRKKFPWETNFYLANARCNNPKNPCYKYYGSKGVKFLISKQEIKNLWFRDEAYNMEKPSLDRINNNGDYTFENCQFIEHRLNSSKDNYLTKLKLLKSNCEKGNKIMRKKSGNINYTDKLTAFLYILMRDSVTPGRIEEILINHIDEAEQEYTNGWLAKYANYVAERLK